MADKLTFVGGLEVFSEGRQELVEAYKACKNNHLIHRGTLPALVFSANGESVAKYNFDPTFRVLMEQANIVHADGMSVVWAAKLFSFKRIKERSATTDFFHDMAKVKDARHFFLGASEEVNREAVSKVKRMYPELVVAGRYHGYFDPTACDSVVEKIRSATPDIIWVAMGRPYQEQMAIKLQKELPEVIWVKTCGGLFDFLAGRRIRAPLWLQKIGMEWVFRMALEPRRLFGRYIVTNIQSIYCFVKHRQRFRFVKRMPL